MTSDVTTVHAAHVQRLCRIGAIKRRVTTKAKMAKAKIAQRAQSVGGLYGIGTGVWGDKCSANGPASNPL